MSLKIFIPIGHDRPLFGISKGVGSTVQFCIDLYEIRGLWGPFLELYTWGWPQILQEMY